MEKFTVPNNNTPEEQPLTGEQKQNLVEQKKAEMLALQGAIDTLENKTPAQTQDQVNNKNQSAEGFKHEIKKIEDKMRQADKDKDESAWESADKERKDLANTIKNYERDQADLNLKKQIKEIEDKKRQADKDKDESAWESADKELKDLLDKQQQDIPLENSIPEPKPKETKKNDILRETILQNSSVEFKNMSNSELMDAYKENKKMLDVLGTLAAASHVEMTNVMEDTLIERGLLEGPINANTQETRDQQNAPIINELEDLNNNEKGQDQSVNKSALDVLEELENKDNKKSAEKITALSAIVASAKKSLDWMRGKNSPWSTPSMIAREERKIRNAESSLENGNLQDKEDKKTAGGALAMAAERGSRLKEKSSQRGSWLNRHWKKIAAGTALLGLFAIGPKSCESTVVPDNETIEKTVTTDQEIVCGTIEVNDGASQVLKKALESHPEFAQKVGIDPNNPEALKQAMVDLNIMDLETGKEFRFNREVIGSQIDFQADAKGKIMAFYRLNPNNPDHLDIVRSSTDTKIPVTPAAGVKGEYITDSFGNKTLIDDTTANPFNLK